MSKNLTNQKFIYSHKNNLFNNVINAATEETAPDIQHIFLTNAFPIIFTFSCCNYIGFSHNLRWFSNSIRKHIRQGS